MAIAASKNRVEQLEKDISGLRDKLQRLTLENAKDAMAVDGVTTEKQ